MAVAGFPLWDEVAREAEQPPQVWREGARVVVWLHGEQDMGTAARVGDALAGANALGDGDVVVDLGGVGFMDSAIVAVLVGGRDVLASQARNLSLRAPPRPARRVLELCGLAELIDPQPAPPGHEVGTYVTLRGPWAPAGR